MVIGNKDLIRNYSGILSDEELQEYKVKELKENPNWESIPEDANEVEEICIAIQDAFLNLGFKIEPFTDGSSLWELNV